jgi:DNA gyrase subunit A
VIAADGEDILFATEYGYGKKVSVADFRIAHRGGVGVRTIPTDKRNGLVIGLALVTNQSELLLIDEAGKIIRLPSTEIRTMGRQAKGVRLIRLDAGQKLAAMFAFDQANESGGETDGTTGDSVPTQGGMRFDTNSGDAMVFMDQEDERADLLRMDRPLVDDDIFAAF